MFVLGKKESATCLIWGEEKLVFSFFLFQFLQAHILIFGRHHVIQKMLLQDQIILRGVVYYHSLQLKGRFMDIECLLTFQCTITSGLDLIGRLCIIIAVVFPLPDGWVRVPRKFDCLIKTLCRRTLQSFSFFHTTPTKQAPSANQYLSFFSAGER